MRLHWRLAFALLVTGCDPGRAPYDEAAALEEQGKLAEAADKFDTVRQRAPESKLCAPSTSRAAALRLKLADRAIETEKFSDAETTLKLVQEMGDPDAKTKAKLRLGSKDLVQGLAYERAVAKMDKRAALAEMEAVAASSTPISGKAAGWLATERPALLLADATAACTPRPTSTCPTVCARLTHLHPGSPEARTAEEFMAAHKAAAALAALPKRYTVRFFGAVVAPARHGNKTWDGGSNINPELLKPLLAAKMAGPTLAAGMAVAALATQFRAWQNEKHAPPDPQGMIEITGAGPASKQFLLPQEEDTFTPAWSVHWENVVISPSTRLHVNLMDNDRGIIKDEPFDLIGDASLNDAKLLEIASEGKIVQVPVWDQVETLLTLKVEVIPE